MDKRLAVELVPGLAFIAGSFMGGLFLGAGLAAVATAAAVFLRWRWDKSLPWLAISVFTLSVVLLAAGLVFDDTTYVKISPTIGSLAFAAIIAGGLALRPSLLRRTLGYSLHMTSRGWAVLHAVWIGLSIVRAGMNEVVWRNVSDAHWAVYNGLSDFVWLGLFFAVTWFVANRFWLELDEE
ncbi:MAG: septation protein IspZ [Rhodobacteraceae bacterium]|nr:septation protein IspZ [Paracoccaceae bacterium]